MKYTVVDVETTGGGHRQGHKIIEIALINFDGDQVEEEFVSLVNPERSIPYYISQVTGITNDMVENAPKFYEIAKKVVEMTQGRVIVAHNVRFDYGFLRREFQELGFNYVRKNLCTVRLARKVVPGLPSYRLNRVCDYLNVKLERHHRAYADTKACLEIFKRCLVYLTLEGKQIADSIIEAEASTRALPALMNQNSVAELPESGGLYYFHDQDGNVLYVGKSKNIKKRVFNHLAVSGIRKGKKEDLKNTIADVSWELIGSDLVTSIKEAVEIKRLRPHFNRALKRTWYKYGIYLELDELGYKRLKVRFVQPGGDLVTTCSDKRRAEQLAYEIALENELFLDYENGSKYEDYHQGRAFVTAYNRKVDNALKHFRYPEANFMILEKGRAKAESFYVWVENHRCLGFGTFSGDMEELSFEDLKGRLAPLEEDRDIRQILLSHLRNMPKRKLISLELAAEKQHQYSGHFLAEQSSGFY